MYPDAENLENILELFVLCSMFHVITKPGLAGAVAVLSWVWPGGKSTLTFPPSAGPAHILNKDTAQAECTVLYSNANTLR